MLRARGSAGSGSGRLLRRLAATTTAAPILFPRGTITPPTAGTAPGFLAPAPRPRPTPAPVSTSHRPFTTSPPRCLKPLPPRPRAPPEAEIEEFYLKGSGPGGQKINKTNSAVQLRHTPTGIVVKSQATRSREQNRKIARELLAARLDELRNGEQSRTSVVADVKRRKAASAAKKSRRKYRLLEQEEQQQEEGSVAPAETSRVQSHREAGEAGEGGTAAPVDGDALK